MKLDKFFARQRKQIWLGNSIFKGYEYGVGRHKPNTFTYTTYN